jgi:hypothetical protein
MAGDVTVARRVDVNKAKAGLHFAALFNLTLSCLVTARLM